MVRYINVMSKKSWEMEGSERYRKRCSDLEVPCMSSLVQSWLSFLEYAEKQMQAEDIKLLTGDLSDSAEHIQFLRVQSLDAMIHISEREGEREREREREKGRER